MEKNFTILGETFEVRYFPHFYAMYKAGPDNLERQLKSIADKWHDGSIVSAVQALESDLGHG